VSSGEDCTWLDYIVLPFVNTASAYAGPDQLICETNSCILHGEVLNANSFEWSSSGDGNFSDPTILDPEYIPGAGDISTGEVFLTLGATYNQTGTTFDEMYLEINGDPGIPEIPDGPEYIDLLTVTTSEYTSSPLPSVIEYEWKLKPNEAGIIEGNGLTGTVTWDQSFHGLAYVSLRAIDTCGPGLYSEQFEVLVDEGGLGISEAGSGTRMMVYPNPNTGSFTLDLSVPASGNSEITIFNAKGIQIMHEKIMQHEKRFSVQYDLGKYPDGLYFIQLQAAGSSVSRKIILHR
jgi:hypothetical protein